MDGRVPANALKLTALECSYQEIEAIDRHHFLLRQEIQIRKGVHGILRKSIFVKR